MSFFEFLKILSKKVEKKAYAASTSKWILKILKNDCINFSLFKSYKLKGLDTIFCYHYMDNKIVKNSENSENIFVCKICSYSCLKKQHWLQHIETIKHNNCKMVTNGNKMITNGNENSENSEFKYRCECGKNYKYNSGLSRHKRNCKFTHIVPYDSTKEELKLVKEQNSILKENTDTITTMFMKLVDENKELTNKIVDLGKQPTTYIKQQNNQFNVLSYLNTECNEAMNLSEFIEQLQISFDDLLVIKNHGFIESIQQSFINKLKDMEQTKRPIHCTDKKRKSVYVKEENTWARDNNHKKINKAITDVNNKQYKTLNDWFKKNPTWNHDNHTEDKCLAIMNNIYGIGDDYVGEKNRSKLVNMIVDSTLLQK